MMKGFNMSLRIVIGLVILVIAATVIVALVSGQNQNLLDFGKQTIVGSMNGS